uniref:Uncharacterized protein n=1 Tax=Sus scrofa TaxID=9823 RepID=A0A4X1WCH5_PIG
MEIPRLGIESELQLPAYTTATATQDPSHICDLHHSSQQCWILNPLSEARDQTCDLMDTRQVHNPLSHGGNSMFTTILTFVPKRCLKPGSSALTPAAGPTLCSPFSPGAHLSCAGEGLGHLAVPPSVTGRDEVGDAAALQEGGGGHGAVAEELGEGNHLHEPQSDHRRLGVVAKAQPITEASPHGHYILWGVKSWVCQLTVLAASPLGPSPGPRPPPCPQWSRFEVCQEQAQIRSKRAVPLPPDCPQHWNKLYAVLAADTGMLAFQGTKACLLQSQPPTTHRHGPGPATKAPLPGCQLGALITGDG